MAGFGVAIWGVLAIWQYGYMKNIGLMGTALC